MLNFTQPIPLSLYIHLPWCIRKCPYCDFNSHPAPQDIPEQAYLTALLQDLKQDLPLVHNRSLISIFLGGGTPSLFSAASISQLLSEIKNLISTVDNIEITLEANPGTFEQKRFQGFYQAGVNRLSIGIQSLQDTKLQALGRIHDASTAITAVEAAKKAGFSNFNLDLMYGLPKQSVADALYDLQTAIALSPSHISWYQLTLEPNTYFHRFPPPLPNETTQYAIWQAGLATLQKSGYLPYEISAYSLPGMQSQHNRNYWEFGDYLAIGAGAHSKITDRDKQTITRYWKHKHPKDYMAAKQNYIAGSKIISSNEIPLEFMLNALRLSQAIPFDLFQARTGLPWQASEAALYQAREQGLLIIDNYGIEATELGRRFLNDTLQCFMSTTNKN